jgi:hypothetical protein
MTGRTATVRDIRRTAFVIVAVMVFAAFFSVSAVTRERQDDLLSLACGNARGHHDLTIAVEQAAGQVNRIAMELGLPIEPVEITVPEIPEECREP